MRGQAFARRGARPRYFLVAKRGRPLAVARLGRLDHYKLVRKHPARGLRFVGMETPSRKVLVAAPRVVVASLAPTLQALGLHVIAAETVAEAEAHAIKQFALILVCYVFDDLKPYRLVHLLRNIEAHRNTPLVLIRALPIPIGDTQLWEMENAYHSIGVDEVVHHAALVAESGREHADEVLRNCLANLLKHR